MFLRGLVSYLNTYLMSWVTVRAISDLRTRLFEHLLRLPSSFFNKTSTGELISRIGDVGVLQSSISGTLSVIISEPATLVFLVVAGFWRYPELTILSLLIFPVSIVPVVMYSRKVRRSSGRLQSLVAELAKIQHESFTGNRIIKAYNLEETVVAQFKAHTRSVVSHTMRITRSMELPGPLIELIGSIGVTVLFAYLALRAQTNNSGGDFLIFVLGVFMAYKPAKTMVRLHSTLEQARAATQRVFDLLETKSDLPEAKEPKVLRAAGAEIRFDGVSFDYGEKPVLRDINLTVKGGQMVALVGSSGAGKTTLTNLLLRFYDPTKGSIQIDGTDLREVALRDLRAHIAVVTQETVLFNDSILRNIELGKPGATISEIEDAARHARALEFILEKPGGFEAVVGEKGVSLSGGQRQRIAIARAIVRNAPILILDEATNALDAESERAIQTALDELMQGRTTFCIAHRLSTIQKADLIVVMEHGRIVETGRHAELLAARGVYHRLHSLQFQDSGKD
jgi:subfamily B ATP-binding cassette protein MsbA